MAEKLLIGWSEADITPVTDKFISLSGQYYERLTKEIHSRLKTVAVAFSCGGEQFITASMDNGGMQQPFHELVCKLAHEMEPEIQPDHIVMNAIHTHSAPGAQMLTNKSAVAKENVRPDVLSKQEYVEFVAPIMAKNLVDAWHARKPGGIARGFGNARIGHCRRAVFSDGLAEMYGDCDVEYHSGGQPLYYYLISVE